MGKADRKRKNRGVGASGSDRGSSVGGGEGATAVWSGAQHSQRKERQLNKTSKKLEQNSVTVKEQNKVERRFQRTSRLTHDSQDKREEGKLRLNITKTQRDIEKLRKRLQQWDDTDEKALAEKQKREEEEERRAQDPPPKKRGRLGPESWKLKGAARPAWQVCEFDVRYECPHQKAHEQAHAKARRVKNLTILYRGKFGHMNNDELSYLHRRHFLALLMQLGLLCMESKKYKSARLAFLECLELDGVTKPITSARCHLMRLYLQVNRPQSVHQLWNTNLSHEHETSPWVLFSVALVEYIRWKDFRESDRLTAETALARAIRANILCAFYLAFSNFFHKHMEYTDEVEEVEEEAKGSLEEAIEYCCSEQMGMWAGTDGALDWVKDSLLRVLHGQKVANGALSLLDLEWSTKLQEIEDEKKARNEATVSETPAVVTEEEKSEIDEIDSDSFERNQDEGRSCEESEHDMKEDQVDTLMYVSMYRTTMEMLYQSGALSTAPPKIVEEEEDEDKTTQDGNAEEHSAKEKEEPENVKQRAKSDDDSDDDSS